MTQQVGSTSGTASAARETEVAPGGASGTTEADPRQNGSVARQGQGASQGQPSDIKAGRVRGWLRRAPAAAAVTAAAKAPSVEAVGPELDLASNDPLVATCSARPARWTSPACNCSRPRCTR